MVAGPFLSKETQLSTGFRFPWFRCVANRMVQGASVLALLWVGPHVWAKPRVDVVTSTSPGGGPDLVARVVADILNTNEFQAAVRNVTGVAGELAVRALLKGDPNGITLLVAPSNIVTINPHVHERAEQKLWRHAIPVLFVGRNRSNMVITGDRTVASLQELIAKKRAAGLPVRFASTGVGSFPHLVLEAMFARHGSVDRIHVPYKGASDAITGLLGGDIDVMISGSAALNLVLSGRLHAVAVVGDRPSPHLPGLPTTARDHSGLSFVPWFGVFAHSRTEPSHLQAIRQLLQAALGQQPYRERLSAAGIEYEPMTENQFVSEMDQEFQFFKLGIERLGLETKP